MKMTVVSLRTQAEFFSLYTDLRFALLPVSPYTSPMPCRILKILAPSGTKVKKNDPILTVESMKTEVKLLSRHDGVVTVHVEEGQMVDARVVLCQVE
jgi:3-methylcrotonyl-CoA carboxylase alpha subunit